MSLGFQSTTFANTPPHVPNDTTITNYLSLTRHGQEEEEDWRQVCRGRKGRWRGKGSGVEGVMDSVWWGRIRSYVVSLSPYFGPKVY